MTPLIQKLVALQWDRPTFCRVPECLRQVFCFLFVLRQNLQTLSSANRVAANRKQKLELEYFSDTRMFVKNP